MWPTREASGPRMRESHGSAMVQTRQRRPTAGIALIVIAWSLAGLLIPLLIGLHAPHGQLPITAAIAADNSTVHILAPTSLGPQTGLTIQRGTVHVLDPSTLGSTKAVLQGEGLVLVFDGRAGSLPSEASSSSLVASLARGQFASFRIRRSTFVIAYADGRSESLGNVNAVVTNRGRNGFSLKGDADLRGLTHAFDLQIGPTSGQQQQPARVPLKLAVKGPLLTANVDGKLFLGNVLQLHGNADFVASDIRRTARAFGLDIPDGPTAGPLKGRGKLDWQRSAITFDKAVFQLERTEALGTLTLKTDGARPLISGTLAFNAIDLSWIASGSSSAELRFPWSLFEPGSPLKMLASALDLDVRMSASGVHAPSLSLGPVAATITLDSGKLLADVAEAELGGGRGNGQISVDLTRSKPAVVFAGKLEDADAASVSQAVVGAPVLTGPATLRLDVTAEVANWADIVRTLDGRLSLTMAQGGRLGLDVRAMLAGAPPEPTEGWAAWTGGNTSFDRLDLKLLLQLGIATTELAAARSGENRYVASGTTGLIDGRVDLRVGWQPSARDVSVAGVERAAAPIDPVRIRGPVAKPHISRESAPRDMREGIAGPPPDGVVPRI